MKITFKNLPKLLAGSNLWYRNLNSYDPSKDWVYNTDNLIDGDTSDRNLTPWKSNISGNERGRYLVTLHGALGTGNDHFKYTQGVEGLLNYIDFGNKLLNDKGEFTELGLAWAKKTDELVPEESRFFNPDGTLKTSWSFKNNDAHGRPGRSFNNLKDYVNYVRNDQLLGARHNIFSKKGKRYFYIDNDGNTHYVDPNTDLSNYNVDKNPTEQGWGDDLVYWEDYQITGPKETTQNPTEGEKEDKTLSIDAIQLFTGKKFDWGKLKGLMPNLLETARFASNLANNERVYDEALKGIRPDLRQGYSTHRQVVGDEATKQAYYRKAAQGQTKAARAFTSDADRQMAYQMEAKRIGDELRAQGDLADNQEIRRTSDESNLHQWANAQRATEVANANTAAFNKANALRHNLIAQKYSANQSSLDNYLQGIEYRMRLKLLEDKAIEDQIFTLQELLRFNDNPDILNARNNLLNVAKKYMKDGVVDKTNPEYIEAQRQYLTAVTNAQIESYRRRQQQNGMWGLFSAKEGMKIIHKRKDDLLYKSTRDVVEHFRKMSKISSDALDRPRIKLEKLTSHPKGKAKKYLQGGVAPFTIFKPVALGGETTTSTQQATTSSSKENPNKDKLDLVKKLFESVEGLPVDVNLVYKEINGLMSLYELFGNTMSTDDIASVYLNAMRRISNLKFSKSLYEQSEKLVNEKDANSEFAIDQYGRIAALDVKTGKVEYKKWDDIKNSKSLNPLTNRDLLNLRAYSPDQAFRNDVLSIANNATSMTEIANFLKSQIPTIGSSETTLEGYTKHESNQIKAGLELLKEAPNGDYKYSQYTKDLQKQALMAMNYLIGMLPKNMKTLLAVNSDVLGISPDKLLISMIGSRLSENSKLEFDAVTGKAAKDANGNSKGDSEGLKLNAATALVDGKGYKAEIELNPGSSYAVNVQARFSEFLKPSGENMGAGTTMLEATESTIKGNLDWNKATIGGSKIIPTAYNQIILNNGEVAGMDLPVDPNNPDAPDLEMLKQLETLDKKLKLEGIEDNKLNWKQVNDLCDRLNIPKKYNSLGKLNQVSWKRFAAFLVTTPDTALVNKSVILDMVGIASDQERELYNSFIQLKTKDKNFELSDKFLIFGHRDELYKGTVFVPIKENIVAAAISSGQNIYMNLATDLEMREQGYDLDKVKSYKKSEFRL